MFWSMVVNMLIFLFIMMGIFYLMDSWNNKNSSRSREPYWEQAFSNNIGDDSALRILKKRYAKGEITKEEFIDMKEEIQNH